MTAHEGNSIVSLHLFSRGKESQLHASTCSHYNLTHLEKCKPFTLQGETFQQYSFTHCKLFLTLPFIRKPCVHLNQQIHKRNTLHKPTPSDKNANLLFFLRIFNKRIFKTSSKQQQLTILPAVVTPSESVSSMQELGHGLSIYSFWRLILCPTPAEVVFQVCTCHLSWHLKRPLKDEPDFCPINLTFSRDSSSMHLMLV